MALALITGASKGIGKAIAIELAKKKVDVLLVARSADLLERSARALSETYGVSTDYLSVDLTASGAAQKIARWCHEKNYAPDILINNAGFALSGSFNEHALEEETNVIAVNLSVVVELTHLLLPVMLKQTPAYILNISSQAAFQSVPGLNVYAASKAFIKSFSRGLRFELKKTNISVTVVFPGATNTNFASVARVGPKAQKAAKRFNMSPDEVAGVAIGAMYARKAECTPGFLNKLARFMVWLLPAYWSEKTAATIYEL